MSGYIVPTLAAGVLLYGLVRRVDVYEAFAQGAAEGLPVLLQILPYLAAMLVAVRLMTEGGVLAAVTRFAAPACTLVGLDERLLPLLLIRPFSGSASMALLTELFAEYGPDSLVGITASVLMGSSETIFYEVALYFGVVGVKKTRFAVPVALLAAAAGAAASVVLCNVMFK